MAKGVYVGVGGVARKVKKIYVGVDGVARKVKRGYIGVGGVARLFFSGGELAYYGEATAGVYPFGTATSFNGNAIFAAGGRDSTNTVGNMCRYDNALTRTTMQLGSTAISPSSTSTSSYAMFCGSSKSGSAGFLKAFNSSYTASNVSTNQPNTSKFQSSAGTIKNSDMAVFWGGGNEYGWYQGIIFLVNNSLTSTSITNEAAQMCRGGGAGVSTKAIFAGGVYNPENNTTKYVFGIDASSTITKAATGLTAAVSYPGSCSFQDKAVFAGGMASDNSGVSAYVAAYDASLTKTVLTNLSASRSALGATSLGDFMLFAGGARSGTASSLTNICDVYDASFTRTTGTPLTFSGSYVSAATTTDYLLFGGGYGSSLSTKVCAYVVA